MGLLVSISMILAVLATITLLAAILSIYKPEIKHKIRIFEDEEE
jgi:predicted RND superfamily exporter protein